MPVFPNVYYPRVSYPRTSAFHPPRLQPLSRSGINTWRKPLLRSGLFGFGAYVESPAYQGSNGLGADAPTAQASVNAAIQQALQTGVQIGAQAAQNAAGIKPTAQTIPVINSNAYQPPAPQRRWLPWAIGGGSVVLLGGILLLARRR